MKLRVILLALLISALFATLVLALRGLGLRPLSGALLCVYIAGAVFALILAIRLSDKQKVETPWMLWLFVSNEFLMILFVALWPVLAPLAFAEIMLRGKSKVKKHTMSDDAKGNT